MGLRDRVKSLSDSTAKLAGDAASRAREKLDEHGITTENISAAARDIATSGIGAAQAGMAQARTGLEVRGTDLNAIYVAALDGAGVTNRKGKVKRWRIARAVLRPTKTGRQLTSSVVREILRQRPNLRLTPVGTADPLAQYPGAVALDEAFFAGFLELTLDEAGVADDDQNRAQLVVYVVEGGIGEVARNHLTADDLARVRAELEEEEEADPAAWTKRLLTMAPEARHALLERLSEIQDQAVTVGSELGVFRFFRSSCCESTAVIDLTTGEQRCEACGAVT